MGDKTGIAWTDATWNPVTGCSKVSQGCKLCYALREWPRLAGNKASVYYGRKFEDVQFHPERLDQPLRWKKPRRVFVNSMSDLFHESVPDLAIDQIFAVMGLAVQHQFQVLTKRPDRMMEYTKTLGKHHERDRVSLAAKQMDVEKGFFYALGKNGWHVPNVWLGVSVENQDTVNERLPYLYRTPAAIRFISYEPALGPVNFYFQGQTYNVNGVTGCNHCCNGDRCDNWSHIDRATCPYCRGTGLVIKPDWVIIGGESGIGARPFKLEWARSAIDQCRAAGIKCFVKQIGRSPEDFGRSYPLDFDTSHGGDWLEWPREIRIREYPEGVVLHESLKA